MLPLQVQAFQGLTETEASTKEYILICLTRMLNESLTNMKSGTWKYDTLLSPEDFCNIGLYWLYGLCQTFLLTGLTERLFAENDDEEEEGEDEEMSNEEEEENEEMGDEEEEDEESENMSDEEEEGDEEMSDEEEEEDEEMGDEEEEDEESENMSNEDEEDEDL